MRVMEPGAWLGAMLAGGMPMGHVGAKMITGIYQRRRRYGEHFSERLMSKAQIAAQTAQERIRERRIARNAMAAASRKRNRRISVLRVWMDWLRGAIRQARATRRGTQVSPAL